MKNSPSTSSARAFTVRDEKEVDGNRDLLALGASNIGAGFFHGFPVSSSGSRTALTATSGARTQAYSLFLHPLLARFPTAALGAIVLYAATRLVNVGGFRKLVAFRRSELLLASRPWSACLRSASWSRWACRSW